MNQVAILVPLMRSHRIAPVVQSIQESTQDYSIIVIATGECADASRDLPVTLIEDDGGTWAERINVGYKATTEPYIFCGADDLAFRPGWFEAARRVLEPLQGVVAINDLYNTGGVHFLVAKTYVETFGGVIDQPPGIIANEAYAHAYVDDDFRATAIFHNRWGGVVNEAVVEHLHAGSGKAPMDEIYKLGESTMAQGHALFTSRAHLWAN